MRTCALKDGDLGAVAFGVVARRVPADTVKGDVVPVLRRNTVRPK